MKDNFSTKSEDYARYRPGYPVEVYDFLRNTISEREQAWDCGTGNGQVASSLSQFFQKVYATDISVPQLMNAQNRPNIYYSKQKAEKTNFPDASFDLITVAQAIHWFDFESFYREVRRTMKPDGIIAVMGYGLFRSNNGTDKVIYHFYHKIIGLYWDDERRYLDEEYKTIPFPFKEIMTPEIHHQMEWSFERLIGYLKTWSAVKHYEKAKNENPVDLISNVLRESFGERGKVVFPMLFRVGKCE